MEKINIVIDDENCYFAAGLRHSIMEYAQTNNKSVCFLTPYGTERPDVVFASMRRRAQRWRRAGYGAESVPVVTIKERPIRFVGEIERVLRRSDEQGRLFELLSEILTGVRYVPTTSRRALTGRERQVMDYLRCGLDQSQAARMMGVSVKTVHSHKRSAMRKLMLYRNHELLYWLLSHEGELS
ncbi:helix-turn-helix transcriptional regulator [Serratia marcescens]|uniref:helix-turn-helix transcriptional regulator n=1 Tax=Serratia marcescens TaxID=615 RepID=UPI000E3DF0A8|nr:LuxR C-terminal-related transcriptional regulator [Serratia marcescens]RFS90639.1 helix-turn-helix transcriptional regulator [Serratia marcescens]